MKRHQLIALASVVLVACVDGGRSSAPSFAISDAAHGGGTRGFYFLPPMVPNPTPTGTFDRFRSPTVEICQLAGDENSSCTTTIATFTMTSGPGSVIRVVPADKHYIVNWHTNLFPDLLPPPAIYRIQVFDQVSGKLLGFADVQLADNGKEAKSLSSNEMIGLVDGRTLPIKFRIEFGAVDLCPDTPDPCAKATVGPEGGQLVATDDDGVALAFADFPAGWTDTPRDVTISQIVRGCDGECGPGEGPLEGAPEGSRQYPLFFEYLTVPPATPGEPFNLPVRIGVCNVGEGFGEFHPPHRGTTALALGAVEDHGFVILDFAPTSDLLGGCVGVTPTPGDGGRVGLNRLDGGWQGLLARAGVLAANVFAPRALNAAVLVDGGMGGSTEFFSPVGTVDTAPPEVEIDGTMSPGEWGESVASLLVNLPGEGTTSGDLFISNDATNLYFAVRFQRSVVDPGNSAAFEFDSNDNSSLDEGDDGIILNPSIGFRDLVRSSAPPCPATVGLCSFLDTQLGGTNDGAAAFRNDGTFTVYEFSHPLSSGDVLDFSRSAGQTLGLFLSIRLLVSGATFADTRFPAEGFYTITIGP